MEQAKASGPDATVAVIGAGPAGLMAAEVLSAAGFGVVVLDRMPSPARKLLMAGRGGLNLTHSEPLPTFLSRYGKAAQRLEPAVSAFPPSALVAWAESLGENTFVGSSGRVFPKSLKASPLLRAWLLRLNQAGVTFKPRHTWTGWDEAGALIFTDAAGRPVTLRPAATVLALGGASWPRLGSDGSWVGILERAGVPVTPLKPTNCGVLVGWTPELLRRFEGAPLKRIAVSFEGRSVRGEAVITRQGLEGGPIYALSQFLREALVAHRPAIIEVDLRPDLDLLALERRLGAPRGKQSMATFLRKAAGLSPAAIGLARESCVGYFPTSPADLAQLIKHMRLEVGGIAGLERAISTAGGIRLDAVDASFMLTSRPGVFAAGEMLDWEAPTGGYLLQGAFCTGRAAALGLLTWLATTMERRPTSSECPSDDV